MDKRIKCTACKRVKFEEDFLKNQKVLKTCISCRDKKKTEVKEPLPATIPIKVETKSETEVTVKDPQIVEAKVNELPDKRWIGLSGFWIQKGDEPKLHKKLMRKLNRQFHQQCAFPVHKYLTRWVMVDIRDRYIG